MAMLQTAVETGALEGIRCGNSAVTVFRGIPFAKPPVGQLRWREPQPAEPWSGVRKAYEWGSRPMQFDFPNPEDPYPGDMSEDCLYLNIWTPANSPDEKLPVLFWINGGAFRVGSGHMPTYDGEGFAKQGVILVSINYRIGLFGFLCHKELSAESEHGVSGNYAIFDQIAALKWCRRNISAFGGDPDRITIFGQSAGGMSVHSLVTSPLTAGDLYGAIFESGGGILGVPDRKPRPTLADVESRVSLRGLFGVDTIAEARNLPAEEVVEACKREQYIGMDVLGQVVDGYLQPRDMTAATLRGEHADIHYICSCTLDEGMARQVISFGENQAAQNRSPAYLCRFSRRLPGDDRGASHGAELGYVFQTLQRSWRPFSGADYELSLAMSAYWANFAKNGDPNGPGLPVWLPYTANHRVQMDFNVGRIENVQISPKAEIVTIENFPYPELLK